MTTSAPARTRTRLALGLAAPYVAVAVCWFGLRNALLASLTYHGLILLLARGRLPRPQWPAQARLWWPALPAAAAGPLLYLLLPHIACVPIASWLAARNFSTDWLPFFLPYFGLLHPWIEQAHWRPLRERTAWAHPLFAGYHVPVLVSLTSWPWLVASFGGLTAVSFVWDRLTRRAGNLLPAYLSHALADTGIVLAAWLLV